MPVVEYMQCVCGSWVIVLYIACMFLVSCLETTACLPDICLVACIACDFVYSAFFVFWDGGMFFLFYVSLCRCGGSECCVYIGVLEQIGYCSYFWAMIGESGPDLVVFLIRVLVCFLLYPLVEFLEQLLLCVVFCFCLYCLPYHNNCSKNSTNSGRSHAEIVGSNPTGGMDICLL